MRAVRPVTRYVFQDAVREAHHQEMTERAALANKRVLYDRSAIIERKPEQGNWVDLNGPVGGDLCFASADSLEVPISHAS